MNDILHRAASDFLNPATLVGGVFWGLVFLLVASGLAALIRRAARRIEPHLSDATGLRFVSALGQVLVYLILFLLYSHLIPALRTLATTLLTGVGVISVVVGLAAQSTLSNLIAGFSLVLYRPVRVGDLIQITTPKGLVTATVRDISLGYTVLLDADRNEVIVPNSVMVGDVVIKLRAAG